MRRIHKTSTVERAAATAGCNWSRQLQAFGACAIALGALLGCGERSDRLAIAGKIVLDGVPLDSGSIRFTSLGEGKLRSSGAMIQDGAYAIPQDKGLSPGTYHVELSSPDTSKPPVMVRGKPEGVGLPAAQDRIPAEYNMNSQKTIEVTPTGDNHFDFNIQSKTTK